jgi:hypothetical protein
MRLISKSLARFLSWKRSTAKPPGRALELAVFLFDSHFDCRKRDRETKPLTRFAKILEFRRKRPRG